MANMLREYNSHYVDTLVGIRKGTEILPHYVNEVAQSEHFNGDRTDPDPNNYKLLASPISKSNFRPLDSREVPMSKLVTHPPDVGLVNLGALCVYSGIRQSRQYKRGLRSSRFVFQFPLKTLFLSHARPGMSTYRNPQNSRHFNQIIYYLYNNYGYASIEEAIHQVMDSGRLMVAINKKLWISVHPMFDSLVLGYKMNTIGVIKDRNSRVFLFPQAVHLTEYVTECGFTVEGEW